MDQKKECSCDHRIAHLEASLKRLNDDLKAFDPAVDDWAPTGAKTALTRAQARLDFILDQLLASR